MNRLEQDIRAALIGVEPGAGGERVARFVFPPEFVGFQGHFPGNPVLPGVCMVQAALVGLAPASAISLTRIVSAKWFAPVRPGEELHFLLRETPDGEGRAVVKTRIASGVKRVAELTLAVARGAGAGGGP